MKRLIILTIAVLLMPLTSYAYENDFMRATTPGGWTVKPMKMGMSAGDAVGKPAAQSAANRFGGIQFTTPSGGFSSGTSIANQAIDAGINTGTDAAAAGVGYGVMKSYMKKLPKMAMATFTNRKHPESQIQLIIVESQGGGAAAYGGGGKASGSGCSMLEDKYITWGGKQAKLTTTKCKAGNEWAYTTVVSMKKGKMDYMMMGTLQTKDGSDADFNSQMKAGRDELINTTQLKTAGNKK